MFTGKKISNFSTSLEQHYRNYAIRGNHVSLQNNSCILLLLMTNISILPKNCFVLFAFFHHSLKSPQDIWRTSIIQTGIWLTKNITFDIFCDFFMSLTSFSRLPSLTSTLPSLTSRLPRLTSTLPSLPKISKNGFFLTILYIATRDWDGLLEVESLKHWTYPSPNRITSILGRNILFNLGRVTSSLFVLVLSYFSGCNLLWSLSVAAVLGVRILQEAILMRPQRNTKYVQFGNSVSSILVFIIIIYNNNNNMKLFFSPYLL